MSHTLSTGENRTNVTSSNPEELSIRLTAAENLVNGLLGNRLEYFSESENRLTFIKDQTAESVLNIAQYVNAKMRGEKPYVLKQDENERGASLPALHTPSLDDKQPAFMSGYQAISEYLSQTSDNTEEQLHKVALATEALVVWTHPFNDGNGRTSRFIGAFIENGTSDVSKLIQQTSSRRARQTVFNRVDGGNTKEGLIETAGNDDIMLDDDERADLLEQSKSAPNDIEAMYLCVKHLLENEKAQQAAVKHRQIGQVALVA